MRRRDFLELLAFAAAAVAASPLYSLGPNREGLPRRGTHKKVLVVGAGLAGLSAAYELTQAGHDVTVLEARTRPGSRVHTLRDAFSEGFYAEVGASRIPNHHHFALQYGRKNPDDSREKSGMALRSDGRGAGAWIERHAAEIHVVHGGRIG